MRLSRVAAVPSGPRRLTGTFLFLVVVAAVMWASDTIGFLLFAVITAASAARDRDDPVLCAGWAAACLLAVFGGVAAIVSPSSGTTSTLIAVIAAIVVPLVAYDRSWGTSHTELARFGGWCFAMAATAVVGTITVVHQAKHQSARGVVSAWPSGWTLICVLGIVALSAVGGVAVLRPDASWTTALTWPVMGAAIAWATVAATLVLLGETGADGIVGSCLRTSSRSCERFRIIVGFVLVSSPVIAPAAFIATFSLRRLAQNRWPRSSSRRG